MATKYMTAPEVRLFIEGKTVRAIDPKTNEFAATITYRGEDRCEAKFADGQFDTGRYGFEGDRYWTRYEKFRAGQKHSFALEKIDDSTVQAYHDDGSRAFLMSHDASTREL